MQSCKSQNSVHSFRFELKSTISLQSAFPGILACYLCSSAFMTFQVQGWESWNLTTMKHLNVECCNKSSLIMTFSENFHEQQFLIISLIVVILFRASFLRWEFFTIKPFTAIFKFRHGLINCILISKKLRSRQFTKGVSSVLSLWEICDDANTKRRLKAHIFKRDYMTAQLVHLFSLQRNLVDGKNLTRNIVF